MGGASVAKLNDIDGNGTIELILEGGISSGVNYRDGLPWRVQTDTHMWSGEAFVFYRTKYAAPQYRFQAVQDADQATLGREYDTALDLYQEAIFRDELEWWSPERRAYEQALWDASWHFEVPTPTPLPFPTPDPNEYPNLAAYARYRIILLHILRGYLPEATIVYETLQEKFPAGQPGHEFAEMATEFWIDYQTSQDIGQACNQAVEYARSHSEILTYLGSDYHGWQSHEYTPEDVCPFE
ncbi:MAG TPA: hypothetical protein VJ020_09120 [Anaerolineales bacterium]|nr:hypothetical protein [Anaerolineales bacterium]